ncbi:ring-cleaving dioxygenase [Nitratireductor sp. XY-223]|uniref:ring-cleaving dioxygenase n=1 Tax=Nitratireductor sp. XY-223 TaxID=2561926 RepID=UPI0010AAAA79|nr:ring-cleaving dioxygenase [Nitratireductor sp. XY-223]
MRKHIKGLHHVTSLARDAQQNNGFFTQILGLRRIKKTVNFDRPDVYHLYYGDTVGTPGAVMTYFPIPDIKNARAGTGEVGTTVFAVPDGSLSYWQDRLEGLGIEDLTEAVRFGERRLGFRGPDGDGFALVEQADDKRAPWEGSDVSSDHAIRGFHSATLRLEEAGPTGELLTFMGYEEQDSDGNNHRYRMADGNGADIIDISAMPGAEPAVQGAGSVHHIAFAVDNREQQLEVREALAGAGYSVTPVIDRDYFWAIYFRTPGGVLFEIATAEPGFDRDEDRDHLGEALKLPTQHAHLREKLERELPPITD